LAVADCSCLCRIWRGARPPLLGGVNDDLTTEARTRKLGGHGDVRGGVRRRREWLCAMVGAARPVCVWRVAGRNRARKGGGRGAEPAGGVERCTGLFTWQPSLGVRAHWGRGAGGARRQRDRRVLECPVHAKSFK
jgi:hypothetical protein